MKGIKKALCLLVLLFSVALALPVTAEASTNGHTAQEALAWVRSQLGKSLDYDGYPVGDEVQCVDLIKYYYEFLGCASYARGNGCDYATNALPSGWARYQGAQPQPGDILVYSGTSQFPNGHVAIYEADRVTYHQNLNTHKYVECFTYRYDIMANPYWGVIRPDFVSAPVQATWEGPSITSLTQTNATVAGKVTFSQKLTTTSAGMRLFDQSGNLITYYKPDTTNYNSNYVTFDFNINTELYYTLSPGKTYKVQFYTMSGGKEYTSPTTSFTTPHTHNYQNGLCTICGAKDPNYKLTAPTAKSDYWASTGKPYIKWATVAGASRYSVYRAATENGTYTYIGNTTATNYTDKTANAGTTYYYKVKAVNANGVASDYSTPVAITCRCARPVGKSDYWASTGKPYIKWDAVDGAGKYYVYRSTSKDGSYKYIGSATKTNYTDSTAVAGTTYYYKVQAVSSVQSAANSTLSAAVTITCRCARPVGKSDYWASTGKPYIKWDAVDGAGKYYVYRSTSKDGSYQYIGSATKTNYTDSTAVAGTTYYYKVKAISSVQSAANSSLSTAVTITCRCARPVGKSDYWASTGKPYIKWDAVDGAGKYYVYRSTSKDGSYQYIGSATKTNYTDSTAVAGTTYYYKVKAISSVQSAANSSLSTAVTITCRCARPSVKITTTSAGKPKLTWNAVTGASKYEIYRATSKNGTYTKMYTTTALSYTNTSAKAGTTYYYKVKAVSSVKSTANSSFSTVVSIKAK